MSLRYYTSGITLALDAAQCSGCGKCIEVCPHDVFALVSSAPGLNQRGRVRQVAIIERPQRCMECGACERNCPLGAIKAGSGVGCAAAIINSIVRGGPPTCDCSARCGACASAKEPPTCGCN